MNDFELDAKLKSVPLPNRPDDYWENFPAQLHRQLSRSTPTQLAGGRSRWPFLGQIGVGFACLVIGLLALGQPLKAVSKTIFNNERLLRQQLAALPHHLRVLMADEHGLHYLVADKE